MTKRGCRTIACTSVLALVALALVTATPAFGQFRHRPTALDPGGTCACGGTNSPSVSTAEPIFDGETVLIPVTITSSVSGGVTTNTEDVSQFNISLNCKSGSTVSQCISVAADQLTGVSWAGGGSISGADTTCVDATSTAVTWTVSATTTTVTLTPNNPVHFTGTSQSCNVNLRVSANAGTSGTVVQALEWLGTCAIDGTTCASGADELGSDSFAVDTCGVGLVKQISCDGGATWSTNCTGFTNDPIQVRYMATNTQTTGNSGVALNSCTIHDVTGQTAIPPGGGGTEFTQDLSVGTINVLSGQNTVTTTTQTTGPDGTTPLTCTPAGPNFDTAEIDCVCAGSTTHVQANAGAQFSCETCSVKVDKQVTCNGTTYDQTCCNAGSTTEPFGCVSGETPGSAPGDCDPNNCAMATDPICLQNAACIGFNAYCTNNTTGATSEPTCTPTGSATSCVCPAGSTLTAPQNVAVNYFVENSGQDSVTCSGTGTDGVTVLGLTDTDLAIANGSSPPEGTINTCFNGSTTNCTTSSPSTQELSALDPCSPNLSQDEVNGDTAQLTCQCAALNNNTTKKFVTASDSAIFSCQQPELTLTKTCGAVATGNAAPVSVTATNNGTAPLTNCTITDSYLPNATCGAGVGPGTNPVTLTGPPTQPFTLAGSGGTATLTGNTGVLTANACNEASVTCNVAGSTNTISASFNATCPVGSGCEGATPGFFKNHPETVDEVILGDVGTITSCGLVLNNAEPNQDCSVLNDLAMEESSLKKANNIDPTYRQLVLQCVVAELNLQGTVIDGGNCGNQIPGSTLMFDTCCGLTGVCATGLPDPITGATVSQCQAAVAAFNADRPCLNPSACVLNPGGAAQSSEVKTVNTLNDPPGTGADCGGSRNWVTTSKKK